MKTNFPLSDIELNIDDDIIAKADDLYEKKSLKSLAEPERNLWTARFMEEGMEAMECEIQLSGSKVKNFTCECDVYKDLSICHHIVSALMALRKRKNFEKDQKQQQAQLKAQKAEETPPRLIIPNILKKIEPQQLIDFMADYARKDKEFALALKTRFAGDMNQGNPLEYYKILIDNTLRSIKNPKGNITPKGWLQMFTMLDELRQKAEIHFKNGELNQSLELIKIALPLVHRYLRSSSSPKSKLERRQVHLFEILRGYDGFLISPELGERIWEFVMGEYYFNARFEFSERLFDWLLKHCDSKNRFNFILQNIDNQINTYKNNFEVKDRLLTQKIQVLQKSGRVDEASQLILSSSQNPEVIYFAIENALEGKDIILAKNLCMNGLQIFKKNESVISQLDEYLLEIAKNEADTEGVHLYAQKRFLKTLDIAYFNILKKYNLENIKIKNIVQDIENQSYRIEKRDALAAIYHIEKDYEKLFELVEKLQSMELLRRFGVELWRYESDRAFELHKKIIYEYLYTHLGRPPAQRVRTILESHINNKATELADKLINDMKTDFSERYSLKEEFELMMAEIEKKEILNNL